MGNLWRRNSARKLNVMLVGDSGVGKTSLLSTSIAHKPISASDATIHIDTVIDNRELDYEHNKKKYHITLWDTGAQPSYSTLRSMSYPIVDIFFLVFSVCDIPTFEHIINVWVPEIRKKNPKAFLVLIGTKIDVRAEVPPSASPTGVTAITAELGSALAKKIGAVKYIECSSVLGLGFDHTFKELVPWIETNFGKRSSSSDCILM